MKQSNLKRKKPIAMIVLWIALLLTACTNATGQSTEIPLTSLDQARASLTAFLDALSQQAYDRAASLYGGDTDILKGYNPDLPANDLPALLERACQVNGFQCLPMKSIVAENQVAEDEFVFTVNFLDRNGDLFTQGPCCGADEAEEPAVSEFQFIVKEIEGQYLVLDLPPYVP